MSQTLLRENEGKRLNLRLPLLICFALYMAWQMGVVYFSGQTLSFDGRTPLPIQENNFTILFVAGFLLSIAFLLALPRFTVWAERVAGGVALLSALALFLPLPSGTLMTLFYVQYFCCIFMTGLETSLIAGLFTEQTAAKHLLAAYPLANLAVVFLHNGYVEVSATAFRLFTVLAVALLTVFFWRLPAKTWPRYTKKEDALAAPKPLLAGILTLTGLSCFANLFGTAVAESVPHGVAVLYLSASVCALAVFLLWKRWGVMPLTSCSALAALSVMGFVAAIAAQYIPGLFYAAAVLLGAGVTVCWLNPFFGLLIARRFPSKWIVPAILGVAFLSTLIQIALLEALRESPTILYLVYLVVAVAMTILYFQLKPYLQFLYRGRTLQDISEAYSAGEDAEPSADAEAPTPDETAESRAAAPVESDPAESEALRRLKRAAFEPLSPRECQVGEMTMLGVRRGIIAAKLGIEASTVDYYRSCVYNKFGVSNRDELVARVEELNQALDEKKGRDYHE